MRKINCTQYKDGKCLHQAAPSRLFGVGCLLEDAQHDARKVVSCRVQVEHPRPIAPPPAPGKRAG